MSASLAKSNETNFLLDFSVAAPWNGYCHTIHISFDDVPVGEGLLQIKKQAINFEDGSTWEVIVFEVDPAVCAENDIWFVTHFAVNNTEEVQIEYNNPDGVTINTQITLVSF